MSPQPGQKTVLITGCTPGGIGHALALEFHARGLFVIATARRTEVLAGMDQPGMTTVALDVTSAESIRTAHAQVAKITGGRLDILVNNAGRTHTHPATDLDLDDVRQTFETNVFGVMAMCKGFSDQLVAARGLIVNIASLAAITPYVFGSAYSATKGAVVSYSRTMRLELAPFGVRVMVGMVGTVKSNIAGAGHRSLPPDSLYQRIADVFTWRLTYSQNHATVATEELARQLAGKALAREVPVFLRAWVGRPDWFYGGGQATTAWFGSAVGEWLLDVVCYRKFRMPELLAILQKENAQKKLN